MYMVVCMYTCVVYFWLKRILNFLLPTVPGLSCLGLVSRCQLFVPVSSSLEVSLEVLVYFISFVQDMEVSCMHYSSRARSLSLFFFLFSF